MELHEEIRRARKELDLSQAQLADLVGIQRRQISILERGGNVTLNTLKKVLNFLPNLREFTFEQIRMKPEYRGVPPFEWALFYAKMQNLQAYLDDLTKAVNKWLEAPRPTGDPEEVHQRTESMAKEMMDIMQRKEHGEGGKGSE